MCSALSPATDSVGDLEKVTNFAVFLFSYLSNEENGVITLYSPLSSKIL